MYANAKTIREHDTYSLVGIPNAATQRVDLAYLTPDPDSPHWASVQWLDSEDEAYQPGYRDCWAWIESGVIYLPSDGQNDRYQRSEDDQPEREAGWYDPATGIPAVLGIPGTTMVRLV
jgi:hypothetical protein